MPTSGTKLVFFGNERLVSGLSHTDAPILTRLISDGYDIACIVASHTTSASRTGRDLEVAAIGRDHGIPVLLPTKIRDIAAELEAYGAEAAVLVAYGQIIPQAVIDIFPKGIINVHPSLLPAYRGPTPIESALIDGNARTGVSIMKLAAKMDAGPVYAQATIPIDASNTKFDMYTKVVHTSAELLSDALPTILDGTLAPVEQDENAATYSHLLTRDDGTLDPEEMTADEAARRVRAYLGYPKTRLPIDGHQVIITAAHTGKPAADALSVRFKADTTLIIDELIAPSGKKMSGADFIRGYGA